jgi:hypothetical protein
MDKFKKYLEHHHTGLDVETPRDVVWNQIEQQSMRKQSRNRVVRLTIRYGVAACLLTAIAITVKWTMDNSSTTPGLKTITEQTDTISKDAAPVVKVIPPGEVQQDIIPDTITQTTRIIPDRDGDDKKTVSRSGENNAHVVVNTIEGNYEQLLAWQVRKLRSTPVFAEEPGYFNDFIIQFRQIAIDEQALKNDIKAGGLNDKLLEQLINMYQEKLDVLKNLQKEINKMNNRVKQNQQSAEPVKKYFLNI